MTEQKASETADRIIGLLLAHQPNVLGTAALHGEMQARKAASDIAAFRKKLIEELKPEPH